MKLTIRPRRGNPTKACTSNIVELKHSNQHSFELPSYQHQLTLLIAENLQRGGIIFCMQCVKKIFNVQVKKYLLITDRKKNSRKK